MTEAIVARDPAARVSTLQALIGQLSPKDQPFARSLIQSINRYGSPTAKQAYWVDQLIERATMPQQPRHTEDVGSFAKVYALFAKAKQSLQYPKIRLQLPDGRPVALAISGPTSARPNTINVTDGERFGQNKWYGRVEADGTWTAGRNFQELVEVSKLLKRLGEEPEKTASEYGRLTGYCCFCARQLTDEKSTAVGYGPVCAEKFGLAAEYKAAKPVLQNA